MLIWVTNRAGEELPFNSTGVDELYQACEEVLEHLRELREAWSRGCINETDGKGGTRSNRNVDMETLLRKAMGQSW